jgi:hypothetical protein
MQTDGSQTRANARLPVLNAQEEDARNRANTGAAGRKKPNR